MVRMISIPAPHERMSAGLYLEARRWLLANDPDGPRMLEWSRRGVGRPDTPERMAGEIIWIILCAGRSAQAARTIERRVWDAIHDGRSAVEAFGYRAKAEAIDRAWRERQRDFESLGSVLDAGDPVALVEWCGSLAYVGDDTMFQLAKNFGADVCKPDIWLCRLAGIPDRPRRAVKIRFPACMDLCRYLADASGDGIATVDTLLWLACNKGIIRVGPDAGEVTFRPDLRRGRAIIE